jgi:hypothetical protein
MTGHAARVCGADFTSWSLAMQEPGIKVGSGRGIDRGGQGSRLWVGRARPDS